MSPQRYEMTMTGTLYAVGVGPGAPDLLTLRAVEALRRVDVILAAASPRNDYSRALETARPHLRPDVRLQRLEEIRGDTVVLAPCDSRVLRRSGRDTFFE